MNGLLTGEILAALPFSVGGGSIVALIYAFLKASWNAVYKIVRAIGGVIIEKRGTLKDWISKYRSIESKGNTRVDITIETLTVAISALFFSVISFIFVDGVLRIEMCIAFACGFVFAAFILKRILLFPESAIGLFILSLTYVGVRLLSRIRGICLHLYSFTVKKLKNICIFTKTDKM